MREKVIKALLMGLIISTLTGCSLLRDTSDEKVVAKATNNSNEFVHGKYYIWHNENETNIVKDIKSDQSKYEGYDYKIFTPCLGVTLKNDNTTEVLATADITNDDIPTLYEGDSLVLYANDGILTDIEFVHFYDHGYTLGFYGLSETFEGSNIYCLKSGDEKVQIFGDAYETFGPNYYDMAQTITIPKIGDVSIGHDRVSSIGSIKGLRKDSEYTAEVYLGSVRYEVQLKANVRMWSEMERFNLTSLEYIGNGIMKIDIPDFVESGYYSINGVGFFRYVKGTSYDENTEFNNRVIILDSEGYVLYDPTLEVEEGLRTNKDALNDSETIDTDYYKITFDNNKKYLLKLSFSEPTVSNPLKPVICYFINDDNKKAFDKTNVKEGTFYNPHRIELTEEEFTNGVYVELTSGADWNNFSKEEFSGEIYEYVFFVENTGAYKNIDFKIEEYDGAVEDMEAIKEEMIVENESENKFSIEVNANTLEVIKTKPNSVILYHYETSHENKNLIYLEQYYDYAAKEGDITPYVENTYVMDFSNNPYQYKVSNWDKQITVDYPSENIKAVTYSTLSMEKDNLKAIAKALENEEWVKANNVTEEEITRWSYFLDDLRNNQDFTIIPADSYNETTIENWEIIKKYLPIEPVIVEVQ